ncbi:MAG TPA: Clp protease N-terminal domain-containing protein [Acidimicrobiales bacterium]|nr:Clp protease N-terminal domain-containing protein [Acidimicrobiales bacterium]
MFERFTDRARRSIVIAQDAARDMGHPEIKPEHLLYALTEGEGVAANAMAQSGVDAGALRDRVAARFLSKTSAKKLNKVPFSGEAKKALEQSLRAALELGHNYIGTEHLFLGVEREAQRRGASLDELLGASTAGVHDRVLQILAGARGPVPTRSPALQAAMGAAAQQAGRGEMTTGHLLAAMVADEDSQAAKALLALGASGDAVANALAQVPVAGTSDAAPVVQSIAITVGGTTTLISDPDVVAALRELNSAQLRDTIKRAVGPAGPDQAAS